MKGIWTVFLLGWSTMVWGQIMPYYQSAEGLSGSNLKAELHNIIDDHVEFPYTSSSIDTWDILQVTDRDTVDSNNVILLYSGRAVNGPQEYNNASGWTREHVWAKSRGDFGNTAPAGTDVHHLRPLDNGVNSSRSNRNFDNCVVCTEVVDAGFATSSYRDDNEWVFESRDDVKGDVARMLFYMAVRYEGDVSGEPDLELTEDLQAQSSNLPLHAVLSTLLAWHQQDTVSQWERNRNEVIFTDFQLNRNPFIDYPELANHIWGDAVNEAWPKIEEEPLTVQPLNPRMVKAFPQPVSNMLQLSTTVDRLVLYDLSGRVIVEHQQVKSISMASYQSGIFIIQWQLGDNIGQIKVMKE